jgi:hypothetical protein
MKGDFSSIRNGHSRHYTGVLKQQGRVDLDADWNEYVGIQEYIHNTVEKDVIGACGVPKYGGGFHVGWDAAARDLTITAGRIYVDGILCELEDETSYLGQPYYPGRPALEPADGVTDLIYLDLWQRHVTAVEDPEIREKALGGPDTTTRLQTICQIKAFRPQDQDALDCAAGIEGWPPVSGGFLSTRKKPAQPSDDPCLIAPGGGYRGLENRLYRVEIHRGTGPGGPATFKWSRDNGSVVFPVEEFFSGEPNKVRTTRLGHDQVLTLRTGDWVEVAGDDPELDGEAALLTEIQDTEGARREIILADDVSGIAGQGHPKVRRWDQKETDEPTGLDEGARPIREDEWLDLEDGVQICFKPGQTYRSGDYWTLAARTATGEVERLVEAEPHGVKHHYCRLALVTWSVAEDETVAAEVQDCRKEFPPLTERPTGSSSCCTVTVGDGETSHGDFTDIQSAVDAVRGPGRVCVLPGEYRLDEPVTIHAVGLSVSGCGIQARIIGPEEGPAFRVEESFGVWLGSLYVEPGSPQGAITVTDSTLVFVKDCFVSGERLFSDTDRIDVRRLIESHRISTRRPPPEGERVHAGPALTVSAGQHVVVVDNYFLAGVPGISIQARDVRILRNVIGESGGVWVRDGSREVRVEDNEIAWGLGPGVLLGGLAEDETPLEWLTGVASVDIAANSIFSMEGSGIYAGVAGTDNIALGDVEDVKISRNRIVGCARTKQPDASQVSAVGGIVLNETSLVLVHENHIAENGDGPACGVFAGACEGLEVTDNTILDNGTALEAPGLPCIDFGEMEPSERGNPRIEQDVTFTVFDFEGEQPGETRIVQWGEQTGLLCGVQTVIELPQTVRSVELILAAFARPGMVEASDSDGETVDRREMQDGMNGQPQALELGGGEISKVVIRADQDELLLQEFCAGERQQAIQGGIVGLLVTGAETRDPEGRALFSVGPHAARVHDNVVVTPQGQALLLTGAGPMSVAGNSFSTRGIGRPPALPDDFRDAAGQMSPVLQGGACVFVYNLGRAPLLPRAFSVLGPNTNIHSERVYRPADAIGLAAFSERVLADGRVSFHGNQVTLDAVSINPEPDETRERSMADPGAVVLFSFDDVSLLDNQVIAGIEGGTVFFNAAAVAATVRVSGNRFSESPQALYSCVSYGQMNNTSNNQAIYCILALGNDVIDGPNQVLFESELCAK